LLGSLGGTQLVVTHDLDFVSRFADRVIALQAGRLVASGAPAEILKDEAALDRLGLL